VNEERKLRKRRKTVRSGNRSKDAKFIAFAHCCAVEADGG
jgi:hypothetical protein